VAYELGRKVVLDTEEFDSYAYGISSPTKRGNVMFEQTFTSFEAAKSNLRNLLLTRQGERVMQPEFGTGLHELLFGQIDEDFETNIQTTLTDSVSFWLPYITIDEITIEATDEMKDKNQVGLEVSFKVGTDEQISTLGITFQG
jgi:phage baseplate assembly protein W